MIFLSELQRSTVSALAAELRAGGWLKAVLAYSLILFAGVSPHNRYGRPFGIVARRSLGHALAHRVSGFERAARILQGPAGAANVVIAGYSLWTTM
jgi:hypothetical protein